jgi:hypothetical protein
MSEALHRDLRTPMLVAVMIVAMGLGILGPARRAGAQQAPTDQQLDTLVAPIALYPDALVADILPASTYPIQIVEAERIVGAGSKPDQATMSQWDPSVQALVGFPSVLKMMNDQLSWTTQLGQAVAQSQSAVMAAVQRVRAEAKAAGNLDSNDKQVVTTQGSTIIIQPANPQIIYVPQYDPVAIIAPAPAYAVAPAGYGLMTFGLGFAAGAMTAYACNWGGDGHNSINVNNNYNYYHSTNVNNVHNANFTNWKAPTNVGHISNTSVNNWHSTSASNTDRLGDSGTAAHSDTTRAGSGAHTNTGGYGSGDRSGTGSWSGHGGDAFQAAGNSGWSARQASSRGAQSFGGGGFGRSSGGGFGGRR